MTKSDLLEPAAEGASRRQFLATTGVGAASLIGAQVLPAQADVALDLAKMPSEAEVWRDVEFMNSLGPRHAGNAAHQKYMAFLNERLASAGLTVEPLKRSELLLWEETAFGIKTESGKAIPVASICRWSALTGPKGLTAPVKFIGRNEAHSSFARAVYPLETAKIDIPADVRGKIAVVEIMSEALPYDRMFGPHLGGIADPTNAGGLPPTQPIAAGWASNENRLPPGFEENLKKAGAVGVIYAWANGVDDDASGQYRRTGTEFLPSLWVGLSAAKELRALSEKAASITMTVDAKVTKNVSTVTPVAILPGQTEEVILLWTNADGMNAVQENGTVAVINLMKYFGSLPKSSRKRTIAVVMSEGHMATRYLPDMWWQDKRPDFMKNAVVALAPEHLGCREWIGDPATNTFKPTGKPDITWAFTEGPPDRPNPLVPLMLEALKGSRKARTLVIDRAAGAFSPGLGLWRQTKIPTIAYITTPAYFLAEAPNGHIDKLDPAQFHDQMQTLARLIHLLDAAPKNELRPA